MERDKNYDLGLAQNGDRLRLILEAADQFLIGHGSHPPLLSVDALGACSLW